MFPLKRRRKYARIYKEGLIANVTISGKTYLASINDISASGCNIVLENKAISISIGEMILIDFNLNGNMFSIDAKKVRENSYNFKFSDRAEQAKLNNEILTEYFKDTPELIPVCKD